MVISSPFDTIRDDESSIPTGASYFLDILQHIGTTSMLF
jgi:hypothetical protein